MLKKLFQRLGRYRVIMDRVNGEPYLERYYVFLSAGLVPTPSTEWNWILMWNVGHYSCLASNNETGASWFAINGCSGNNIWQIERPAYD